MLYVILGKDAPGALETRKRVRARHLERTGELADAGRVALAGPCPIADSPQPGPEGFWIAIPEAGQIGYALS